MLENKCISYPHCACSGGAIHYSTLPPTPGVGNSHRLGLSEFSGILRTAGVRKIPNFLEIAKLGGCKIEAVYNYVPLSIPLLLQRPKSVSVQFSSVQLLSRVRLFATP